MKNPELYKKLPFAKKQKWAPKVKNDFTPESDNVYDYLSAERFFWTKYRVFNILLVFMSYILQQKLGSTHARVWTRNTIDVPISDIRIAIFDFYSMFDVVLRKLVLASSVLGALL